MKKIARYIPKTPGDILIILAIIAVLTSAITFLVPTLTPPEKLALSQDLTAAEIFADIAYFLFLVGLLLKLPKVFKNDK